MRSSNALQRRETSERGKSPRAAEIRQLRGEMELTRQQLSALVYASVRTVDAWENGLRRMPAITWELLCMIQAYPEVERCQKLWRAGRAF
jgi:DNA-binding transcriptional regulator YiaG